MRSRWMAKVAIAALLAFGSVHSWADISPIKAIRIGIGEPVRPVHDADVRMVSEEVNISLGDSTAFVSCRFDLKNEGTTKNLPVGFPCVYGYDISNFRAWVNGKEIPVKMIEPIPAHKLNGREPVPFRALFTVPFGSDGKTVVVETRYRNRLVPNEYWGMKDLCFEYILQTGSYWKGYIESAKITVDYGNIPPGRIACISPDGYTKNGHSITWRLKDFKPRTSRDDIRVDIIQKELYSRMGEAYFLLMENPSSARGHYLLGTILFNRENKENRYKDAEREFLRAVALDPGLLDARFLLAVIYCMPKDYLIKDSIRNADTQLREILKRDPDYSFQDWQLTPEIFRITHMKDTRASEWLEKLSGGSFMEKRR